MEIYDGIIKIIDVTLVYSLIPLLLTLILVQLIFKDRFKTRHTLNLIRWFIIFYTILIIINMLIGMIVYSNEDTSVFINRATGPYMWAYWTMIISSTILSLTLFYKKLASKALYILLIAISMKLGKYFELFVIIQSSYQRDYLPAGWNTYYDTSQTTKFLLMFFLKGFIIAILLLGIYELIERFKTKHRAK